MARTGKASEVTLDILEVIFIVTIVAVFFVSWFVNIWTTQGSPVAVFGAGDQIYAEPVKAGEMTTVQMPISITRKCVPVMEESQLHFVQMDRKVSQHFDGGIMDFGPIGQPNREFRYKMQVPPELEPGPAAFYWTLLWNCGLRDVEMVTPIASMEVRP